MIKRFVTTVVLLLSAFFAIAVSISGATDPLSLVEADYSAGRLTLDERVLLQIQAIKSPASLPDRYRPTTLAAGQVVVGKCPTATLAEIRSEWEQLAPATKSAYLESFLRAVSESVLVSPSGYFKLHYDTSGVDAVPVEDLDLSGYPDFVEKCAAYLDSSLASHQYHGYRLPPSDDTLGGDNRYDIYFEAMGYYGYAIPEGPGMESWDDAYSYVVLHNTFLGFPPNNDPEGDQAGAAKATCAHEFHHSVQFAYDASGDGWFMEMDATHFEDIIFDHVDDNYSYLPGFFSYPEKALMENGSHSYSSFPWGIFLTEKFDTTLMQAIWDGARYDPLFEAMADTLMGWYGWTTDSAFAEFAAWNYLTQSRYDGAHYLENYPFGVKIGRSHSMYPVLLQSSPYTPAGYGACYIQFYPGSQLGTLEITVNGDDARQWAAVLVKSTADNVHTIERITLTPSSYYAVAEVPDIESYYRVTLVMANIMEYSTGAYFNYSAKVTPPYAVSSTALTLDSAVYSGGGRPFLFQIANTAPIVDILDVTAWDSNGWVALDTFSYSLGPEQDSIVAVQVSPPAGTSLGNLSDVWFKVISRGDPEVADSQSVAARTVLQRGDVDFQGEVKVSDLTYMVNFLFRSGDAPLPVIEAGDFSCDAAVNVSDLTLLVRFLFMGGSGAVCNPY